MARDKRKNKHLEKEAYDDDDYEEADGGLYYIAKGKGKGKGKEKGGGFQGECSWCGKYGHRLRDCRAYTQHLQNGGAPVGGKGKGKQPYNPNFSTKGAPGAWTVKGGGKGKFGAKGDYINYFLNCFN